jgi:hypothetical protein
MLPERYRPLLSKEALFAFNRLVLVTVGSAYLFFGVLGILRRKSHTVALVMTVAAGLAGCLHELTIRNHKLNRPINVLANSLLAALLGSGVFEAAHGGDIVAAIALAAAAFVFFIIPGVAVFRRAKST